MKTTKKAMVLMCVALLLTFSLAFVPLSASAESIAAVTGIPDIDWYDAGMSSFTLTTADQLAGLAQLVNNGNTFAGKTVILGNNIDLSGYGKNYNDGKGWVPIGSGGNEENQFSGTFDGKNKKITGLYICDGLRSYSGLFAGIRDSTVKNLGIAAADIAGFSTVGGLVAWIENGIIQNCYVTGTIGYTADRNGPVGGGSRIGGMVGEAFNCKVKNCYVTGTVSGGGSGSGAIGGVAGSAVGGNLVRCYATGVVNGSGYLGKAGGVVGSVSNGIVQNCYATSQVNKGGFLCQAGGVAGTIRAGTVRNCYATGAVNGEKNVGGVAGLVKNGKVINCAALNPLVEATNKNAGRVVGLAEGGTLSGNVAFSGMNTGNGVSFAGEKKHNGRDGMSKSVTALQITSGFPIALTVSPWTYTSGKLPGLAGKTVKMPTHLRLTSVTGVSIVKPPVNMINGKSETLKAKISPSNATSKTVTWSTSNQRIATVNSKTGQVTAKEPGKVTITARADGKKATCQITVHRYVSMRIGKTTAIQNGNKTTIDQTGAKPFKVRGRTMLPLRFVGEKMGGRVRYTADKAPIYVQCGDITIELKINDKKMTVTKGKTQRNVTLDVAAQKRNGRVYLPLRAISEALGFQVKYEARGEYIVVNNPKMSSALLQARMDEARKIIR